MTMQHAPVPCACAEHHGYHCGDCGAPARVVKRRLGRPDSVETVVVCLNVDGCGHLWQRRVVEPISVKLARPRPTERPSVASMGVPTRL